MIDSQAYRNYLVINNPALDANTSGSYPRKMMYLSGTSMATPAVAGAVALMMQVNPKLTPNIVKTLLTYTAQTINGSNEFEQGTGRLNVDGTVRLAKTVRQDLSAATLVGAPLLTAATPAPQSTIAGQSFTWGQGVIMDYSFATGINLITKYQGIYKLGVLMGDGTIQTNGVLMSYGVLMGDNILTGNGALMSDGYPFLSCGVLMGAGVLLSDGVLISDGVLMGDSVKAGEVASQSGNAIINGDSTVTMMPVNDFSPNADHSNLTATAISQN